MVLGKNLRSTRQPSKADPGKNEMATPETVWLPFILWGFAHPQANSLEEAQQRVDEAEHPVFRSLAGPMITPLGLLLTIMFFTTTASGDPTASDDLGYLNYMTIGLAALVLSLAVLGLYWDWQLTKAKAVLRAFERSAAAEPGQG